MFPTKSLPYTLPLLKRDFLQWQCRPMDLAVTTEDRLKTFKGGGHMFGIARMRWPHSNGHLNLIKCSLVKYDPCRLLNQHVYAKKYVRGISYSSLLTGLTVRAQGSTIQFLEGSRGLEKQMWFLAGLGLCVEISVGLCPGLLQHCWHCRFLWWTSMENMDLEPGNFILITYISWYHQKYQHCIISDKCTAWMNCNL